MVCIGNYLKHEETVTHGRILIRVSVIKTTWEVMHTHVGPCSKKKV